MGLSALFRRAVEAALPLAGDAIGHDVGLALFERHGEHTGRMPARFLPSVPSGGDELGRLFAAASQLEAASVHAFRILAAELRALGAPEKLVQAARHAAADEIRHARATARLARRFGAEPPDAKVEPRALRPLGEVALENAVEGCVRETWGALVATWQARTAEDPGVRATMAAIAPDETRHAELAWEIDAWAASQLTVSAYDRIVAARRAAAETLLKSLDAPASDRLRARAGVPAPQAAKKLFESTRKLWS